MRNYAPDFASQVSRRMLTGEFPGLSRIRFQLHGCSLWPTGQPVLLPFVALSFRFNINYAIGVA